MIATGTSAVSPDSDWPTTGGRLVYAVGDVHGRDDLLVGLLHVIEEDWRASVAFQSPAVSIMLGDYVDRGPSSCAVIERLIRLRADGPLEWKFLRGNHEQAMLDYLDHKTGGEGWVKHGGGATMLSYDVSVPGRGADRASWSRTRDALREAVPDAHVRFLRETKLYIEQGDYVFVHAGLRPGIVLAEQSADDLLWIRNEFLVSKAFSGRTVVHGHTPIEQPYVGMERINLDTGAYMSGVLTAARLDGSAPRLLSYSQAGHRPK